MGTWPRSCVRLGAMHPTPYSLWCTGSGEHICDRRVFGNLSVTSTPQITSRSPPEPGQEPAGRRHMVHRTSVRVGCSRDRLGRQGMNAANLTGHPACPSSLFQPADAVQARAQPLPLQMLWRGRGPLGAAGASRPQQAAGRGRGAPCVDFAQEHSQTSPLSRVNKYLRITAGCSL